MYNLDFIKHIIFKLENYILSENYKGYDPYDVLNSPIFKLPILRSNKSVRFGFQQIFRRIPINLRLLLGIKKSVNPVTLGLCIQAYSYLLKIFPEKHDYYISEINKLLDWLMELSSRKYNSYCWGYNFDWEARYARIGAFTPTVVATGIITNGLYEYYKIIMDKRIEDVIISSANFVLNDLNRTYEGENFCFSYSPNDNQLVYNATMKGARLLAQTYSITNNKRYLEEAEKTVKFVVNNQNPDGSWYYSKGDARKWVDNFHTAYILDCLKSFIIHSKYDIYNSHLQNGLNYYLKNLFTAEYYPKYYNVSFFPIDSTEVAQAVITLSNFDLIDEATSVLGFGIEKLFYRKSFKYQIRKFYTINIPYMRWSTAYWFCSLCFYLNKISVQTV